MRCPDLYRLGGLVLGLAVLCGLAEAALRVRYRLRALPTAPTVPGQITVVALGDSIVAGAPGKPAEAWPAVLARLLQAARPDVQWRVINAGVSGDTAPRGYARFERDVAAFGPQIVLIAFGLNDCVSGRFGMDLWLERAIPTGLARSYLWQALISRATAWGRRIGIVSDGEPETERQPRPRVSAAGFVAALEALIARTRAIGAQPVLLTMTPLASAEVEGVRLRAHYADYNRLIRMVAGRHRVVLVELDTVLPPAALEADGFHLTAEGQAWVASEVLRQLATARVW